MWIVGIFVILNIFYLLPLIHDINRRGVLDTTLRDKVSQWLAAGEWFYPGTPVSFTNKTDRRDITEILLKVTLNIITLTNDMTRGRRGRDRMVVGFITTYAVSAYHHWCCEFESRSGRGVQHHVIKFVSGLRQVSSFLRVFRFPPPIKLTATIKLK